MSLIKQLWLLVISIVLIAFLGSIVVSTISSKHSLENQLRMKNIDNASSLALSISQMEKDPVQIDLMVSAQFDSGHYESIRLSDPNNTVITEKINSHLEANAPIWFTKLIDIQAAPGVAHIQDGWKQFGAITVKSDTLFAYQELWHSFIKMFGWSVAVGLLSGLVGTLAIRFITKPINEFISLAEAIGERRFINISEPKIAEFKSLAYALNRLSIRIRSMLKDQSHLLEELRHEANYDPASGVMSRKFFIGNMATIISSEESFTEGVLVTSHLTHLADINKQLGQNETDGLLRRIGGSLNMMSHDYTGIMVGRLSGTDFGVFLPRPYDPEKLGRVIQASILKVLNQSNLNTFALAPTLAEVINKSDQLEGLSKLLNLLTNQPDTDLTSSLFESQNEAEWRLSIKDAITAKRLQLGFFPVLDSNNQLLHHECPARLQLKEDGPWISAGEFMQIAIELDLMREIDNLVLEKAIEEVKTTNKNIGINVSTRAMCNPEYIAKIQSLFIDSPKTANRLWLEVNERGAFNHLMELESFCQKLKPLGCKIGIEHICHEISRFGELYDLGLYYIKVDGSIIKGIDKSPGNQAFLRGLSLIAHSLDLKVIAEGIKQPSELSLLPELGIDGFTGPGVKLN